jgi:hypothetical protein
VDLENLRDCGQPFGHRIVAARAASRYRCRRAICPAERLDAAERAGDRTPDRMQRLLSRAVWDASAVMKVVRRFAVAGLGQAACGRGRRGLAVGAIDETSQVKQGERTAGV